MDATGPGAVTLAPEAPAMAAGETLRAANYAAVAIVGAGALEVMALRLAQPSFYQTAAV